MVDYAAKKRRIEQVKHLERQRKRNLKLRKMALQPKPTNNPQRTDVILAMQDPWMKHIVDGTKNHEFRKYLLKPSVKRIWFYRTAPHSKIQYVCEIAPAKTRNEGDEPLKDDGMGNREWNEHHKDYEGWDYAYRILDVRKLDRAVTLKMMKYVHGMKAAPQGMVYTPQSMLDYEDWQRREFGREE